MSKLIFQHLSSKNTWNYCRHISLFTKDQKINTAGIIVIGDEILKGEVIDTNSSYMTTRLHKSGVKVKKISVIGDIFEDICTDTKTFSQKYTYVITTGGIGPTHDITFEAVAKAFDEPLILHPELVKICERFYNTTDVNSPGMKLARVPKSAKLTFPTKSPKINYPNVHVRNVYMFPGIPQLFERSFDTLSTTLFRSSSKFYTKYVYFNITEDKIVQALELLVKEFPDVLFGSYPQLFHSDYKVKITIESTKEKSAMDAYNKLLEIVPHDSIVKHYK